MVSHRDLKLENILLGQQGEIKIADFGFSKSDFNSTARTAAGSPIYMAPEVSHPSILFLE
jgi:serine/threonine protein kinase